MSRYVDAEKLLKKNEPEKGFCSYGERREEE